MFGGLAVGIPGEVHGLEEAHEHWGNLPWERLVWPSVELAAGWKVGKELAKHVNVRLSNFCHWATAFREDAELLERGPSFCTDMCTTYWTMNRWTICG